MAYARKPRVVESADVPAPRLPKAESKAVAGDKKLEPAAPAPFRRNRMAGSHDGMYVTEHHRGAKR